MAKVPKNSGVTRRRFLSYGIGAIAGIISTAMAVPVVSYFLSPALKRKDEEAAINIGPVDQFPVNKPQRVIFEARRKDGWITTDQSRSAWVVKFDDGKVVVYDPHCTHLGCLYAWHEEGVDNANGGKPHFHSPCHEGIFALDGTVVSGPPPRPLDRLHHKIENGQLLILGCGTHNFDEPEVSVA